MAGVALFCSSACRHLPIAAEDSLHELNRLYSQLHEKESFNRALSLVPEMFTRECVSARVKGSGVLADLAQQAEGDQVQQVLSCIESLLASENVYARLAGVKGLSCGLVKKAGQSQQERALDLAEQALGDEDSRVRGDGGEVLEQLAEMAEEEHLTRILSGIEKTVGDEDPAVRSMGAKALKSLSGRAKGDLFTRCLGCVSTVLGDATFEVCDKGMEVVLMLAQQAHGEQIVLLFGCVHKALYHTNMDILRTGVEACENLVERAEGKHYVDLLEHFKAMFINASPRVYRAGAKALEKVAGRAKEALFVPLFDCVKAALASTIEDVFDGGVEALVIMAKKTSGEEPVTQLLDCTLQLLNRTQFDKGHRALKELVKQANPEQRVHIVNCAETMLTHEDASVRCMAFGVFEKWEEIANDEQRKPLLGHIRQALSDQDKYVRSAAASLLSKCPQRAGEGLFKKILTCLDLALRDEDYDVFWLMPFTLIELAEKVGEPQIEQILTCIATGMKHTNSDVRAYAVNALTRLIRKKVGNVPHVLGFIEYALDDPAMPVVCAGIQALTELPQEIKKVYSEQIATCGQKIIHHPEPLIRAKWSELVESAGQ